MLDSIEGLQIAAGFLILERCAFGRLSGRVAIADQTLGRSPGLPDLGQAEGKILRA